MLTTIKCQRDAMRCAAMKVQHFRTYVKCQIHSVHTAKCTECSGNRIVEIHSKSDFFCPFKIMR